MGGDAVQTKTLLQKVRQMCAEPIRERGLSLWDVTFEKEGPRYLLVITVDKETGVDIDDCEYVSRAVDPQLDGPEFDSLPPYTLCVSSAGLERTLRTPEHFEWALGRQVELTFYRPHDGAKSKIGVLDAYDGETLTVDGAAYPRQEVSVCREHFDFTSIGPHGRTAK